jgi:SAM-dependent methyltransferase
MIINLFRKVRNKLTGLNGIMARFDILQSKLDALTAALENVTADRLDTLLNKLDEIAVPLTMSEAPAKAKCHRLDTEIDLERDEDTQTPAPVVHLRPNEAIRIAFIVQDPSVWSSWRSVWVASCKDPRFLSKVVLTPFIHPFSSEAITYDDLKQRLIDENVPFCAAEFFDVNSFKPHVTFVQNPYEGTRPEYLRIDQLKKAGTRIAYIPYGLEIGGGAWNITMQFDSILHRSAWRIFARSERHKTMFGKYCHVGNDHVFVAGHPKFDSLNTRSCNDTAIELKNKIAGRKVLLWTPHFSVGEPPTWSTFRLYSEFILSEMSRRRDLFLLIRPHPMFFQAMQKHKLWDTVSEESFRQMVNDSDNLMLDENSDYHDAFAVSDALMTDVGSFLLEYLPTSKPILYLHHPNGLGMNDDGELMRYLYTASSPMEIAEFIEMISLGKDPRRVERKNALPLFLYGLDSNVGERICQHIYSSMSAGDSWSPNLSEQGSIAQASSENFWQKSNCTYLAPSDYYDRKEVILGNVLLQQPRFNKAIDIGCGDGRFTLILAKYADDVTGYDISPILVEKAKAASIIGNSGIGKTGFVNQEIETIAPLEKYDLVSCMGVTSCIIEDRKFLRILDKFRMLSKQGGRLLLIDTLSLEQEQIVTDQSGYLAKYRNIGDYLNLIRRRGFHLREKILITEIIEKKLINNLFLFAFNDSCSP